MIKHFCDLCGHEMKRFPTNEERANSDPAIRNGITIPGWKKGLMAVYGHFDPLSAEICSGCRRDVDLYLEKMTKDFYEKFPFFPEVEVEDGK